GFSWSAIAAPADNFDIVAVALQGTVTSHYNTTLIAQPDGSMRQDTTYQYGLYPNTPFTPPEGADQLLNTEQGPRPELLWWSAANKTLVGSDGTKLMSFPLIYRDMYPQVLVERGRPALAAWMLQWDVRRGDPNPGCYLTAQDRDGTHRGLLTS